MKGKFNPGSVSTRLSVCLSAPTAVSSVISNLCLLRYLLSSLSFNPTLCFLLREYLYQMFVVCLFFVKAAEKLCWVDFPLPAPRTSALALQLRSLSVLLQNSSLSNNITSICDAVWQDHSDVAAAAAPSRLLKST